MKKSVGLLLLLVCCAPTIFAAEKPILKSGSVAIDLIKFDAATPKEFYDQSIYPIKPWFYDVWSDEIINKMNIRHTLYHIAHPDTPLQKEQRDYPYPATLRYLCSETFLNTLTPEGENAYLSVLAHYAVTLRGKIEYERQMDYAAENIPQEKRLDMWRILAQHVVFTPEFAATTDGETIKKTLENTLFSILCGDREEAEFLPKNLPDGPLKIYLETVLLKRPTALENLVQVLYQLGMSAAPQWTAEQAAAAIGLARLTEGEEKKVEEKKPEEKKIEEKKIEEKKIEEKKIKEKKIEEKKIEEKKIEEKKVKEKKSEEKKSEETKKRSLWQWLFPPKTTGVEKESVIKEEDKVTEEEIKHPEPPMPEEQKLVSLEEIIKQEKEKERWRLKDYLPSWPFGKKIENKPAPPPAKKEEKPFIVKPEISTSEEKLIKVPLETEEEQTKILPTDVVEEESISGEEKLIKVPLETEEELVKLLSANEEIEESSSSETKIEIPGEEEPVKILPAAEGLEGFI